MKTFYGVADAHGIDSFYPEDKANLQIMFLRANSNRQRHACFFKVDLNEKNEIVVINLLKNGEYALALTVIKAVGPVSVERDHENSWDLIPNPDLDPYA